MISNNDHRIVTLTLELKDLYGDISTVYCVPSVTSSMTVYQAIFSNPMAQIDYWYFTTEPGKILIKGHAYVKTDLTLKLVDYSFDNRKEEYVEIPYDDIYVDIPYKND